MAIQALISWKAPEHIHIEKSSDWYWAVGIITLALTAVAIILGNIIVAIFIVVAVSALVIHSSRPAEIITHQITDRGIMLGDTLFPFVTLDSFWIPHEHFPPKIIIQSRKTFTPHLVILIDEVDPEEVRKILLKYIAEKEHHESIFKLLLDRIGF